MKTIKFLKDFLNVKKGQEFDIDEDGILMVTNDNEFDDGEISWLLHNGFIKYVEEEKKKSLESKIRNLSCLTGARETTELARAHVMEVFDKAEKEWKALISEGVYPESFSKFIRKALDESFMEGGGDV